MQNTSGACLVGSISISAKYLVALHYYSIGLYMLNS
jgi:hypothetical protein